MIVMNNKIYKRTKYIRILFTALLLHLLCACGGSSDGSSSNTTPPSTSTNNSPTGSLVISGNIQVGETLTLSNDIADTDGLGSFNYQWLRTINGSTSDISGATSNSYTIISDDVGYSLSASVSYVDGNNFSETVSSFATAVVSNGLTSSKPNILLIIADDQGLDASAQYDLSTDLPSTPTLDQLAAQGITFDNTWATPACTTTRGSLITGQHGIKSGISFIPARMESTTETVQRFLKAQSASSDYQTAVIGKWHLGGGNTELSHPTDSGVGYYAGSIQGVIDDYYDWDLTINGVSTNSTEYHTTKLTDLAIDWVSEQNLQNSPWFLWLAYVAPHSPFHLPPSDLHSRQILTGTADHINANKRDYYLAAIEAMDSEIGRLLSSMSDDDLANTLIIYIGDNGTPASVIDTSVFVRTHSKGSLYEGGIRIPMIVSGRGVLRQNIHDSSLINTTDFYATINTLAGSSVSKINNSFDFSELFETELVAQRQYNYSEFESAEVTGWAVRNQDFKLIEFADGSQELYQISTDLDESNNLITNTNQSELIAELSNQAALIRTNTAVDITNIILTNRSANCAAYVESHQSLVTDINNSLVFNGNSTITYQDGQCFIQTDNIPNHDFNDGGLAFPNDVSEQDITFVITASPSPASSVTAISLAVDNAVLLNGVKVDLLAAACFGVGDGKVGCNDINQPWRYDPMHVANGFRVDSHNAHSQPDGSYHYHGTPKALYSETSTDDASPVVGFAADGYPIYGSYFDDNGMIRKALSSYRLKSGNRASGAGNPGGTYDGTYRDDYEYALGQGDLDECNGMTVDGNYGYYISDGFPYILSCFKGTPDPSFNK